MQNTTKNNLDKLQEKANKSYINIKRALDILLNGLAPEDRDNFEQELLANIENYMGWCSEKRFMQGQKEERDNFLGIIEEEKRECDIAFKHHEEQYSEASDGEEADNHLNGSRYWRGRHKQCNDIIKKIKENEL